jgi:hypothetical protein
MPPLGSDGKSKRVRMDLAAMERYFQMPALCAGDVEATLTPIPSVANAITSKGKKSSKQSISTKKQQ